MAIFGFKKRKDDKLQQEAAVTKNPTARGSKSVKSEKSLKSLKSVKPVQTVTETTKAKTKNVVAIPASAFTSDTEAIIRPRVTEKSGLMSQSNVYTFEVTMNSNKHSVAKAVKALYKVTPVKIAIVNTPTKNVFVKGRRGSVAGFKKAYITVKAGDKIDFV